MNDRIYFKQIQLGPMANYVYLVGDREKKEAAVIDPAWGIDDIIALAEADDMKITHALVTHYHPDHVGGEIFGYKIEGVSKLVGQLPAKVVVNKHEAEGVQLVTGLSKSDLHLVDGGDTMKLGDIEIKFLHTPGHTPGSQCFLVDGHLVSGDTLFISGCGRVDLPGGNAGDLYDSLHNVLMKLPNQTVLYPGHAYDSQAHSTLEDLKVTNQYLRIPNKKAWLDLMGGHAHDH